MDATDVVGDGDNILVKDGEEVVATIPKSLFVNLHRVLDGSPFLEDDLCGERPARDEETCLDRRTELWVALRDWFRDEAALAGPDAATRQELESDLTTVKYKFKPDGRRLLEPKADQKTRIGRSPDYGDALALAQASRTARRRLDYGAWQDPARDGRGHPCTDERPCGDLDCSYCGARAQDPNRRRLERVYGTRPPRGPWGRWG